MKSNRLKWILGDRKKMKFKRIELNESEIFLISSLLFQHEHKLIEERNQLQEDLTVPIMVKDRAIMNVDDLIMKIIFAEEREEWAIRTDLRLGDLLKMVSTGQMIRVVFLNIDGDEDGNTLEFENDPKDSKYPTTLLYEWVEWISSTPDDYLRVEIITGKGRS